MVCPFFAEFFNLKQLKGDVLRLYKLLTSPFFVTVYDMVDTAHELYVFPSFPQLSDLKKKIHQNKS